MAKNKYKYLEKDEELKLLRQYQLSAHTESFNKLVEFNQLNVFMLCDKYRSIHKNNFEDAISEANIALIKAIKNFDIKSGNRLISFATTVIRNHLIKYFTSFDSIIRLPYSAKQKFKRIEENNIQHPNSNGITSEYIRLQQYNYNTYNIDDFYESDELLENDEYDFDIDKKHIREHLENLMSLLTEEERIVMCHRFELFGYERLSHRAIAERYFPHKKGQLERHMSASVSKVNTAKNKMKRYIKENDIDLKSIFGKDI